MAGASKEVEALIRTLIRQGWTLKEGRHRKMVHPSGKGLVVMSRSPSDSNKALKNIQADIRRLERSLHEH